MKYAVLCAVIELRSRPAMTTLPDEAKRIFENLPADRPSDETDIGLRAYITRIDDEKLGEYNPSWSDERVLEWDGNFKDDGALMLVCCERDVEVPEFRQVLEEWLGYRSQAS
jgi:hypothetical protein